ncbi:MAG TPA: 3D domain-containing protein [Pyrinomonadaceae bacterium]|nr:3D domain-containing protein [Pyrinomonadaceae bacterium]
MKLFFGGSAALSAATLLAVSLLFFAKPLFAETSTQQQQQPTSIEQTPKEKNETAPVETEQSSETPSASVPTAPAVNGTEMPATTTTTTIAPPPPATTDKVDVISGSALPSTVEETAIAAAPITEPQAYVATAYNLPGRTASGMRVAKGIIAADPRVLPLGTRVRLDAGPYSGEYIVADTGSAVKGRKIDVWVPSYREACRFGRRHVRLSVLSYGQRRGATTRARRRSR